MCGDLRLRQAQVACCTEVKNVARDRLAIHFHREHDQCIGRIGALQQRIIGKREFTRVLDSGGMVTGVVESESTRPSKLITCICTFACTGVVRSLTA